jgi:hypothetical protein
VRDAVGQGADGLWLVAGGGVGALQFEFHFNNILFFMLVKSKSLKSKLTPRNERQFCKPGNQNISHPAGTINYIYRLRIFG